MVSMEDKKIIDTHTHYAHSIFRDHREEILECLPDNGIMAVIESAIAYDSNFKMLELCRKYPHVYATVGVHPNCAEELDEEKFEKIQQLLENEKVLAIGETGLDYSKRKEPEFISCQKAWFVRFVELSLYTQIPLVVHCRDAYDELIEILSKYHFPRNPGVIHCFSGNIEQAVKLIDMGFYLGVGGKFLKKSEEQLKAVMKELPLDAIVLETNAPYLKPDEMSGKYNTSLNLGHIVAELAELKKVEEKAICEAALKNTFDLYPVLRQ